MSSAGIDRLLRALRRRQRLADTARLLTKVALPAGLLIVAGAVVAARFFGQPLAWAWLSLLVMPTVAAWAYLRPQPSRALARRIDTYYDLHDRIGNALELRSRARYDDPRSQDIAGLVVEQAEATARELDPRPVVPIRMGGLRRVDGLAALTLLVALLVPVPDGEPAAPTGSRQVPAPASDTTPQAGLDLSLAEPLREDLRDLGGKDDDAAELAEALLELLDELEAGTLDRSEAFARLEALEDQLAEAEERLQAQLEEDPGILTDALWKLAEALEQEPITEPVGVALERGDGDQAEETLAEAGARAEQDAASAEALQRAMGRAERQLAEAANRASSTSDALAEAERRLRRERNRSSESSAEAERRLQRMKRRVEQLRRQHEREKAAQRRIEQLRRNARQAGRGRSGNQRRDARKRLGRGMRNASNTATRSRRLNWARDALDETQTFVRRAGRQGDAEKRRQKQARRFARAAKGKGEDSKKGPKSTLLIEGEIGDQQPDSAMVTPGEGEGQQSGQQQAGQPSGQLVQESQSALTGDGIGSGTDDTLQEPEGLEAETRDVKVDARQGRGVSRAEVIRTASQQGFATEPYRRVFHDYRSFAQSALDNETVPTDKRRQVKRYFQLIQPRD